MNYCPTNGISVVTSDNGLNGFIQLSQKEDIEKINHELQQKAANMGGGDDKTSILVQLKPNK